MLPSVDGTRRLRQPALVAYWQKHLLAIEGLPPPEIGHLLDVAENYGIFLDHACGGVCACTTCHLWIKDQAGISEADDDEIDRMDMAADQQLESRLGCQAVITRPGNYVVEIPKWNRNYVSEGKPLTLAESK